MKLITWNVQWCRGIDGNVDPNRIAAAALSLADFDILCLQEVAINFARLAGSRGENQFEIIGRALPGYRGFFVAASDFDDGSGGRSQFGNAIFTRLPVHQVFRHFLPWPADPRVPSMQRAAIELVIESAQGPLRVLSTHLEYYSRTQRTAQIEALRNLHLEACGHARTPRLASESNPTFAVMPRPRSAIFCGDFNCNAQSKEVAIMQSAFADDTPTLFDAWHALHPDEPHPPSVGLYDRELPRDCWDFAFVSADLLPRLESVQIDQETQASDHQPVIVQLG